MPEGGETSLPWDSPEEYGRRFAEIDKRLARAFALTEYRGTSDHDGPVLRYRLAKLALAAEDLRRAISVLEQETDKDHWLADAVVELQSACEEITDSYREVDGLLVHLLNFLSGRD